MDNNIAWLTNDDLRRDSERRRQRKLMMERLKKRDAEYDKWAAENDIHSTFETTADGRKVEWKGQGHCCGNLKQDKKPAADNEGGYIRDFTILGYASRRRGRK